MNSCTFTPSLLRTLPLCAQVGRASGPAVAGAHAAFGAFLLFNVLFNHAQCVWTSPGTTLDADAQVCVCGGGE